MKRLAVLSVCAAACIPAAQPQKPKADAKPALDPDTEWTDPESYRPTPRRVAPETTLAAALTNPKAPLIAIVGGTVMTAAGQIHSPGTVILEGGRVSAVTPGSAAPPAGAQIIDASGRFVTPGIIDTHSHIGVYSSPQVKAHSDGNEVVGPVTAHARAEYGYWPGDSAISRARAGGVTAALVLPGSANLIGGRGVTVIMRPGTEIDQVRFPGAPPTLKMACGENPKRVYGDKGGPMTRMAEYAKFREAYTQAADYRAKWARYRDARRKWLARRTKATEFNSKAAADGKKGRIGAEPAPEPPPTDLGLETLALVLDGEVVVQIHCYRSDELRQMVAIADEFGFQIQSFHHALEAYKVRDILVDRGIAISTWADWWGFKMEAFDGIPENAALFTEAGGRAVIHSDSSIGIQRLNQEAGKAMYAGRRAGIQITDDQALRWVTANPAWVLGIDEVTGTLAAGKRADVVVWSHSPFSVYTRADVVVQGGDIVYRRADGLVPSDFELGNSSIETEVTR